MNFRQTFVSAIAALLVSTLAIGTAVGPAALAAPVIHG